MRERKVKKLSNLALMKAAIEDLQKETNFTFTDITYGNGYFVFNFGANTVCHFHIKEIPGFRFALWNANNVNLEGFGAEYKNAELILFSQPELTIDKFKPSRSALKEPLSRYMIKPNDSDSWVEEWSDWGAVQLLQFMKKHKYVAFSIGQQDYYNIYHYQSGFKCFIDYVSTHFYYWKEDLKTKIKLHIISKEVIRKFKKLNNVNVILSDYGECWSPRLHLFFTCKEDMTDNESNKLDIVYNTLLDKYFRDLSIDELDKSKFNKFLNARIKNHENPKEDEKLIWKMIQ